MIIAALLVALGLGFAAWAGTTRGYRLAGVVVVTLMAIYTLITLVSLPIFVCSVVVTYVAIERVQRRWLVYGRRLFMAAIVIGMVLPVALFLAFDLAQGRTLDVTEIEFLGSVLPGIAAYNFHREKPELRRRDLLVSVGLYLALVGVAVIAVVLWVTPPCVSCQYLPARLSTYVSPLVLSYSSDIAAGMGLETGRPFPTIGTLSEITLIMVLGMVLLEIANTRLGIRPMGVVTLPLVALFSMRAWWALPLYVTIGAVVYALIQVIHARTFLYGRALLSLASAFGVAVGLVLLVGLGLAEPLVVFFIGLFGGVAAFNVHVSAPRERVESAVVNAGVFVVVFAAARSLITPLPTGLAYDVGAAHVAVAAVVLALSAWVWLPIERDRPTAAAIRAAAPFRGESR